MAKWFRAASAGIGFYLGGPLGALLGYVVGRVVDDGGSHSARESALASHYQTLGIPPTADEKEIKESYRRLVKQYHPDLHAQADANRAALLRGKMSRINEAYREIRRARDF